MGGSVPDSVTDFNGNISERGLELSWSAVADREDISPSNYLIDYLLTTGDGNKVSEVKLNGDVACCLF